MKKLFPLLIVLLILCSCVNKNTKDEQRLEEKSESIETMENHDLKNAKNCDEFIEQYEKWMDDYLKIIEKYVKNPMDPNASQEYMKVLENASDWMNQWTNLATCTSQENYQKRFEEISEKADKKMKELGLD